jgi:hypothetical protein
MVVGDEPQLRARVPRSHVGGDEACKQKGVMAQPKYPGGMSGEGKVGLRVTEGVEQRPKAEAVRESVTQGYINAQSSLYSSPELRGLRCLGLE